MSLVSDNVIASRLLEEAVRLFAHKGYPATSTREIVEAAGVTKPMLYYYFQSKEGLLAAAIGHFAREFHDRLAQVVAGNRPPDEKLVEVVWAQLDFCQTHKPLARLIYALMFGPDDQRRLVDLENHKEVTFELMTRVIREAIAAGLVRTGSEASLLMAMRGMISIWVIAAVKDEVPLDYALAGEIVEDLLCGFGSSSHNSPNNREHSAK